VWYSIPFGIKSLTKRDPLFHSELNLTLRVIFNLNITSSLRRSDLLFLVSILFLRLTILFFFYSFWLYLSFHLHLSIIIILNSLHTLCARFILSFYIHTYSYLNLFLLLLNLIHLLFHYNLLHLNLLVLFLLLVFYYLFF